MNKYDTYLWVRKVILSCKTYRQDNNCLNLIDNFYKMYDDLYLYDELMYLSIKNTDKLIS